MYDILRRSKITFNRHKIKTNANNMRMFESTGMGSLLITDKKDNLNDLFHENSEVISYNGGRCVRKNNIFSQHTHEAGEIANCGRLKTHNEHSYRARMEN